MSTTCRSPRKRRITGQSEAVYPQEKPNMQHDKILILDFGSQVTQLIARRVREAHVFCEVHPCDVSDEWICQYAADGRLRGVILSGSHASLWEDETLRAPKAVFE